MAEVNDYVFETIDKRPGWHREKIVRNILNIETTHKHHILTTKNNKKIKLRTDTWHNPRKINASGKGWRGESKRHSDVQTKNKLKTTLRTPLIAKHKQPWEMTRKELWANQEPHKNYIEGTDATLLVGKHYLMYNCFQKEMLNELSLISISKIKKTSEDIRYKCPQYKELKTQAPPVHVSINEDGTYRLFDGHRRLISAKCRGEKYILAEIHHAKPHKEIVEQAKKVGYEIPTEVQRDYPELFVTVAPKENTFPDPLVFGKRREEETFRVIRRSKKHNW